MYTFGSYWSGVFLNSSRGEQFVSCSASITQPIVLVVDVELFHEGCIIKFEQQVDWIAFIILIVAETSALTILPFLIKHTNTPSAMSQWHCAYL